MQATTFQTITLPPLAVGQGGQVNTVYTAGPVPLRLVLRNLSGAVMFFGGASESMIGPNAPGTKVFSLPAGQEVTFILAPKQQLFGCANGAGALLTMSVSEALPFG